MGEGFWATGKWSWKVKVEERYGGLGTDRKTLGSSVSKSMEMVNVSRQW